jgi:hypothetical protein
MAQRYFTPADVNRLIPELERIVRHLRLLEGEIQEKEWRLRQAKTEAKRKGEPVDSVTFLQEETEIEFLRIVMQSQFERVQEMGGEVKTGLLIDFPAVIEGDEVLLCWKPGEAAVEWFHGLREGFTGRRRIPAEYRDPDWPDLEDTDPPPRNKELH